MVIKSSELRIQNLRLFFSFLILYSACCIFTSCSPNKENPPPADLINEKEMALVISDLTLSEAALTGQPLAAFNDTLKKINVLKEHKLSNERFLSSFKYYSENPAKLKSIYSEVLVILGDKPTSADSSQAK